MSVRIKTKTSAKPRLYMKSRIAPRWRTEIQASSRAVFFSPYVTGRCAERVLLVTGGCDVEVYTLFDPETFASGASSLRCLQRIMEAGLKVYHLPDLHAKMLLIPGRAVTIGSQNLTSGGLRNREASVLITDPKLVRQAEAEATAWLSDRLLITPEMIEDMSRDMRRLKKLFKAAKDAAGELDEKVKRGQRERDEDARREREEKERRRRRLQNLRESVRKLRLAAEKVRTKVQPVKRWSRKKKKNIVTPTLMVSGNCSLTRWRVDGEIVELENCYQYLCLIEETGKLGWARVAASRITFVSQGIVHGGSMHFGGRSWHVTTRGIWTEQEESHCNLLVKMKSGYWGEAHLNCWFSVDGLEVEKVTWQELPSKDTNPPDLKAAFENNEDSIRDKITKLLVKNFKFREGQRLPRSKAVDFFGAIHRRYVVRLAKVGENKILIASGGRP